MCQVCWFSSTSTINITSTPYHVHNLCNFVVLQHKLFTRSLGFSFNSQARLHHDQGSFTPGCMVLSGVSGWEKNSGELRGLVDQGRRDVPVPAVQQTLPSTSILSSLLNTNEPGSNSEHHVFDVFHSLQGILSNRNQWTHQETSGLHNVDAEIDLDKEISHLKKDTNYCNDNDDMPELQAITEDGSDWEDDDNDDEDDNEDNNEKMVHQHPRKVELQHSVPIEAKDYKSPVNQSDNVYTTAPLTMVVDTDECNNRGVADSVEPMINLFKSMATSNSAAASATNTNINPVSALTTSSGLMVASASDTNILALPDSFRKTVMECAQSISENTQKEYIWQVPIIFCSNLKID
uniref:Uncharacterized protein n=1 Tax=Moniliophthora roreri TaxID=221103 RepID=A0A0W0FSF3_MONRR